MTAPHSPSTPNHSTRKIDLNLANVTAAALAAVTTAVFGSELGAAGTVIGAAAASVITTVGTAVYKASLERSQERVRSLAQRTRPSPEGSRTGRSLRTAVNAPIGGESGVDSHGPQAQDRPRRFATLRWGAAMVGAFGAFLLAMMVITGFEWASGETVGGNGKGTTITQVVTDQSGPSRPATPPASDRPAGPASGTPSETTQPPDHTTSSTTPDGSADEEQSPTETSEDPAPSEVTPTPSLIPGLPGIGD
jgi:hypothetical protein